MRTNNIFYYGLIMFFTIVNSAVAQKQRLSSTYLTSKPVIDSNVFEHHWPNLQFQISNDAKYAISYIIDNDKSKPIQLEIKTIADNKTLVVSINKAFKPIFTSDNKAVVYMQGMDSLCVLDLTRHISKYFTNVNAESVVLKGPATEEMLCYTTGQIKKDLHLVDPKFWSEKAFTDIGKFELKTNDQSTWLAYKKATEPDKFYLVTAKGNRHYEFSSVSSWNFSPGNNVLLIRQSGNKLLWFNLLSGSQQVVSSGIEMDRYLFDGTETELAFVTKQKGNPQIWYYKEGMQHADSLLNSGNLKSNAGNISSELKFNMDNSYLVVRYIYRSISSNYANTTLLGSKVKIWGYRDNQVPLTSTPVTSHCLSIDLKTKKSFTLFTEGSISFPNEFNDYLLSSAARPVDNYYNPEHAFYNTLIDIKTGKNIVILKKKIGVYCSISPNEKYVTWFDGDSLNWFSYEISKGIIKNISQGIPVPTYDDYLTGIGRAGSASPFGIKAWTTGDKMLYLYDKYDIWEVDPQGLKPPVCVTKGLGRKENATLGFVTLGRINLNDCQVFNPGQKVLINAFDLNTKNTGIYTLKIGSGKDPVRGTMLPYAFGQPRGTKVEDNERPANGIINEVGITEKYLVVRQSAEEHPNYFLTSDFKNFKQLTNYQPQSTYNWLTAELVYWTLPDGSDNQGMLYKPENFDPTKKYPVIFWHYQGFSDQFHEFLEPDQSGERLNIPYFVSNGYLIFVPDIFNKKGQNSEHVVDVVVSAAKFLSKRFYIDSSKLGLQGHSFGGWETNVLVTHTQNVFAAAEEAAGVSDQISVYNELAGGEEVNHKYYEYAGQYSPYGVGVTPWTNLEVYAKNSPVLFIDKVTTPLLMIHGDKDGAVPFSQGMEMFLALKRAGKKAWLLEYPDSDHGVVGNDGKDCTVRVKQFFDHYLKGQPAPKWMTHPIDAYGQQEKVGYEFDQPGVQP